MCIYWYVYMLVCVHTGMCIYSYVYMLVCVYARMCIYWYVYILVCVYIAMCIYCPHIHKAYIQGMLYTAHTYIRHTYKACYGRILPTHARAHAHTHTHTSTHTLNLQTETLTSTKLNETLHPQSLNRDAKRSKTKPNQTKLN